MSLTGKAKLAGIIGWPVAHSLSPVLHGYWLAEHGIDGALVPLPARAEDFAVVIDGAAPRRLSRRQCHGAAQGSRFRPRA